VQKRTINFHANGASAAAADKKGRLARFVLSIGHDLSTEAN